MVDRRGRALPNDYARLRRQTDPRVAFGPQRTIPALANLAPHIDLLRAEDCGPRHRRQAPLPCTVVLPVGGRMSGARLNEVWIRF